MSNANELFERGKSNASQKKWNEALNDFSEAIRLEPEKGEYYSWRAFAYENLRDYQSAIVDCARYYRLVPEAEWREWPATHNRFKPWYQCIHQHFTNNVAQQAKNNGEGIVHYWPCYLLWDRRIETVFVRGSSYSHIYGSYGSGYICITDRSLYLVSLGQVSQQFPLFSQPTLLGSTTLTRDLNRLKDAFNLFFSGWSDHLEVERTDRIWMLPYQSITDAQQVQNFIKLLTPAQTWEIYEHFSNHLPVILTGVRMCISGKLVGICAPERPSVQASSASETLELLRKLGELKETGIITEEEYEEKKKKLLVRL